MREKGSVLIPVILIVVFILIAVVGYFIYQNSLIIKNAAQPINQVTPTSNPSDSSNQTTNLPPGTAADTGNVSDWKTYTNTDLLIEFKYPQSWKEVADCKFGNICFASPDFEETVSQTGDGGGLNVVSKGALFAVSSTVKDPSMNLGDFCTVGGGFVVSSCTDSTLGGVPAKRRTEVLQNNTEYATNIGIITNKVLVTASENYADQANKDILEQMTSTFAFSQ